MAADASSGNGRSHSRARSPREDTENTSLSSRDSKRCGTGEISTRVSNSEDRHIVLFQLLNLIPDKTAGSH